MTVFDADCRRCPRIVAYLAESLQRFPDYHCAPVASFGRPDASLLVVGLAPGLHGANATGRPFTGDHAGVMLYETLHRFGFANQPTGNAADDDLELINCRITNAVKCVPPANKPVGAEIRNCNSFLSAELELMGTSTVIVALGRIAHEAILSALSYRKSAWPFGHAAVHQLPCGRHLVDSYHCSRYNTNTRRLTQAMFDDVFRLASAQLER